MKYHVIDINKNKMYHVENHSSKYSSQNLDMKGKVVQLQNYNII